MTTDTFTDTEGIHYVHGHRVDYSISDEGGEMWGRPGNVKPITMVRAVLREYGLTLEEAFGYAESRATDNLRAVLGQIKTEYLHHIEAPQDSPWDHLWLDCAQHQEHTGDYLVDHVIEGTPEWADCGAMPWTVWRT